MCRIGAEPFGRLGPPPWSPAILRSRYFSCGCGAGQSLRSCLLPSLPYGCRGFLGCCPRARRGHCGLGWPHLWYRRGLCLLLGLTHHRSPHRTGCRRCGLRGRRSLRTIRGATGGSSTRRCRSRHSRFPAIGRPGSRGWRYCPLGAPSGTGDRWWRQRCVGHVAVRECIVKGHRCQRFVGMVLSVLSLSRRLCRGSSHRGTAQRTLLARFIPHANNHSSAKGRQARHNGKPDRQTNVQLAQDQPASASLPYAVCWDGVFHVRLTLWARGRDYMASGVETPSNCKPFCNTQRTAAVSVTRAAVKALSSIWRIRIVRSLLPRVQ